MFCIDDLWCAKKMRMKILKNIWELKKKILFLFLVVMKIPNQKTQDKSSDTLLISLILILSFSFSYFWAFTSHPNKVHFLYSLCLTSTITQNCMNNFPFSHTYRCGVRDKTVVRACGSVTSKFSKKKRKTGKTGKRKKNKKKCGLNYNN